MMINKVHAHLETPASLLIFPKAFGLFVLLGVCTCEDRLGRPSRRCGWNRIDTIREASLRLVETDRVSPIQSDTLTHFDTWWSYWAAFGYVHLMSFTLLLMWDASDILTIASFLPGAPQDLVLTHVPCTFGHTVEMVQWLSVIGSGF